MSVLKELKAINPVAFFEVKGKIPRAKDNNKEFQRGKLADIAGLTGEARLICVAILWDPVTIYIKLSSKLEFDIGDTFELFIDTRDLKTSNIITRFCHHFIFDLRQGLGEEVTRFRGEDQHEIADKKFLKMQIEGKKAIITLPKEAFYGYNPIEFRKLGLSYRYKKKSGQKQHFYLSSDHFNIEKHPALWSSMELVE